LGFGNKKGKVTLPGSYSRRGLTDTRTSPRQYVTNTLKKDALVARYKKVRSFHHVGHGKGDGLRLYD